MTDRKVNGWLTVFAGFLGNAAGAGVVGVYVFGLFIKEVAAEYDWSRSVTTLGITAFYITSGLGSLFLGSALARWPIRPVTIAFVILFSISLALVALLPDAVWLFVLTFAAVGFFGSAATAMPYAIAIAGWFDRNRGLALALSISGAAASGLFMSRYANWLLENWGWRGGYLGVAALVGGMALIGLLFFFRTPPTGKVSAVAAGPVTMREIWTGDRSFWLIAGPIFLLSVALAGVLTNLPPMLSDRGVPMARVAALMSIVAAASAVSRIAVGVLLDHFHAKIVAASIFTIAAAGVILVYASADAWMLYLGLVCIGLSLGSEADLVTYCVSRYYSPKALSRALAGIWIFWAWGSGLGALVGSASFDIFGGYGAAYAAYAVACAASALIIALLGPYRFAPHGHGESPDVALAASDASAATRRP